MVFKVCFVHVKQFFTSYLQIELIENKSVIQIGSNFVHFTIQAFFDCFNYVYSLLGNTINNLYNHIYLNKN